MKKIINAIIISAAAVLTGFVAMALPFRLFDKLTGIQMRILFIAEIVVYFLIVSAFFLIREAKKDKEEKRRSLAEKHNRRVEKRRGELKGLKIDGCDIAA